MKTPDERMADFIGRCTQALQQQVKGGKTWRLTLPEPADDIEREALRLFLAEVEGAIGMPPSRGRA